MTSNMVYLIADYHLVHYQKDSFSVSESNATSNERRVCPILTGDISKYENDKIRTANHILSICLFIALWRIRHKPPLRIAKGKSLCRLRCNRPQIGGGRGEILGMSARMWLLEEQTREQSPLLRETIPIWQLTMEFQLL